MAKDAKGHGSNSRSGGAMGRSEYASLRKSELPQPAKPMGRSEYSSMRKSDLDNRPNQPMDREKEFARISAAMEKSAPIGNAQAAGALAQGHDKSAPVDVHSAMDSALQQMGRDRLNAWGQTPKVAKQERARLRMDRAMRTFARHGYGQGR